MLIPKNIDKFKHQNDLQNRANIKRRKIDEMRHLRAQFLFVKLNEKAKNQHFRANSIVALKHVQMKLKLLLSSNIN